MRIDHLEVENFKGFDHREFSFHPEFNLIVGDNGSGKTTLLDALAVAAAGWLKGVGPEDGREIHATEVRLLYFADTGNWEKQFPCAIKAEGEAQGTKIRWQREQLTLDVTGDSDALNLRNLAHDTTRKIREGAAVTLPVLAHYRTGRIRPTAHPADLSISLTDKSNYSRLTGYRNSLGSDADSKDLLRWIVQQSLIRLQNNDQNTVAFSTIRRALVDCLPDATDLYFDARAGEMVIAMSDNQRQPFNNLSEGQRSMLAMIGDLAYKAAMLNPHLGEQILRSAEGIVLVDELDLHLHPKWQRHIIEDLRRTFPKLQFFCTTHSPFLIQSLRSGEELLNLDGQPLAEVSDMPLDDIAAGIQGVPNPAVSERYAEMRAISADYLKTLSDAAAAPAEKLLDYKHKLAESIAPYADNPALQAFLEMKRVARLGS